MPAAQSSYFTDNRVNLWREHQKDTPCGAGDGGKGVGVWGGGGNWRREQTEFSIS